MLLVVKGIGDINVSLSLFAPENLVSRGRFVRPVPGQPAHSPHSGSIWCLLMGFIPLSAAASIYIYYRQSASSQCQVFRVTQLRTEGVHSRESAGTGPVVLKVAPVTNGYHRGPINVRLSFPTTSII